MSTAGLYASAFNMKERPFTLLPDPDFLFWTPAHRRAFSVLEYGILSRAPITLGTGEVGAGKTTLLQALLRGMEDGVTVGLISNAQGGRGELLRWALNALGVSHDGAMDYVALFQKMQDYLLAEYAAGRHVVLVIDEAQNLSREALEELRMLTNVNSNKDELLQLILIGQPELRAMIERPELRQFAQRVAASYHLTPMDRKTVAGYIRHRLVHAGGTGEEFSAKAISIVAEMSGGVPRLVNKICDLCMIYAASDDRTKIGVGIVRNVQKDNLFVTTRDEPEETPAGPGDDKTLPPSPDQLRFIHTGSEPDEDIKKRFWK